MRESGSSAGTTTSATLAPGERPKTKDDRPTLWALWQFGLTGSGPCLACLGRLGVGTRFAIVLCDPRYALSQCGLAACRRRKRSPSLNDVVTELTGIRQQETVP